MQTKIIVRPIKSVKKNPNAGMQDFVILGQTRYYKIVNNDKIPITKEEVDKILKENNGETANICIERDVQNYHSIEPDPEYIIKYEKLMVKCNNCGAEFDYDDMLSDSTEDDAYNDEVCPECISWDCLQEEGYRVIVEDENIDFYFRRIKIREENEKKNNKKTD